MSDIWNELFNVEGMKACEQAREKHRAARSAPIADLAEIRRLNLLAEEAENKWVESVQENWDELYLILTCGCHYSRMRVVLENDRPRKSPPRGLCSPVKTDETRRFEALVRRVFPGAQQATMEWRGDD
jgi:hypothetical protein